jgi:hypothetical protein
MIDEFAGEPDDADDDWDGSAIVPPAQEIDEAADQDKSQTEEVNTPSHESVAYLPSVSVEPVVVTGEGRGELAVTANAGASPVHAVEPDAGYTLFPNATYQTDLVAVATPIGDAETFHVIRTPSADHEFSYTVPADDASSLQVSDDGVVALVDSEGVPVAFLHAPAGVDAAGEKLATTARVDGDQVIFGIQVPDTATYPLLLDPTITSITDKMNDAEKAYCRWPWRWDLCLAAYRDQKYAHRATRENYPERVREDGHGDAFRHCYWNARMVISIGRTPAKEIATRHEEIPGNPWWRKTMDLSNNVIGREIGSKTGLIFRYRRAHKECMRRANAGELWVVFWYGDCPSPPRTTEKCDPRVRKGRW